MAQRSATVSRAAAGAKSRARKIVGPKAIGRLEKSLDAAEIALKDLRKELGRGGSTAVKDLDTALKNSRKSFTSARKTILADVEKLQKAATKGTPPKRAASGRPASRSAASKTTSARASAAGKKGAAKTRAKSSSSGTRAKSGSTSRSRSTRSRSK
jgi:hypothetical protein